MDRSPTIDTLGVVLAVFLVQSVLSLVGQAGIFVLAAPVTVDPWTIFTSIYAHASVGHLLANSIVLVIAGLAVERRTTWLRFQLFFLAVGAVAGISQIVVGGAIGTTAGVLGASGAVFGLVGYLLAGNVVTTTVFDRLALSPRLQVVIFVVAAAVVTLLTGRPGVALIAHFTGFLLGLLAGWAGVLDLSP